jgi:hypothetical protein
MRRMGAERSWIVGVLEVVGVLGVLGAAWAAPPPAFADAPPEGAVPLPVDRTTIVRDDGHDYYIDGPTVIPPNAEITVQLGVTIHGINNASLDVQGGLKVHGTEQNWVTIDHVDFSPTTEPKRGLHLDMADLHACTFVHGETGELHGDVTIENSCLQPGCKFDVRWTSGFLKIMTVEFGVPCHVRFDRQRENSVPIEFELRSSWMREVLLVGTADATVRHSEIKGNLTAQHVTSLTVDGCDLRGDLVIQQGPDDDFKNVELTKVNVFGGKVVLDRESGPRVKKERVEIQRFYFGADGGPAVTDPKEVATHVTDQQGKEDGNVFAWITRPQKRQHALVSYDLRSRAPPLSWGG